MEVTDEKKEVVMQEKKVIRYLFIFTLINGDESKTELIIYY